MVEATNPRVFGKYEVIRRLAVGGMGEIFLARQVGVAGFERLVILKSLLPQLAQEPDMLAQFLDEARIVGAINHPSVVACFEVGEWEGVYFIAMEYVNGVDVSALIRACEETSQRFPIHAALAIVREAALGLDSAHNATDAQGRALKIVHRDISPHNIMVRADGLAKVVDFGVAMATSKSKRTEGGLLKGKLGYMAPEAIKGQPVDARSDQFSLGVVLWELLAGRRLFVGESPEAVFMKIVRERVLPPSSVMPDVPPEVDAIVLKMTAPEPAQRYARLAECAAAVRKLLDQRGAVETEAADLVRELKGGELAERVRDLSPSPVRILGIAVTSSDAAAGHSATLCGSCGAETVKGDRFCRSCGTSLVGPKKTGATPGASVPLEPPVQQIFAEVDDDMIDVALDDATGPRETAVTSAAIELIDLGGTHVPGDAMLKPLASALQDIAQRYGGSITSDHNRVSATFVGNGRATRCALAFGRRAAQVVQRAHKDLRMRAGIAGDPGLAHGDSSARFESERLLGRARAGQLLVADRARKLANVIHAYTPGPKVLPAEGGEAQPTWELPLPPALVGRAGERLSVDQAVAAADVGRAQQLLFLGADGTGKTAMLGAVDVEARDRGFIVGTARCGRLRAPLRFDAVRQVMKHACLEIIASSPSSEGAEWHKAFDLLMLGAHDKRKLRALADGELLAEDVPPARRRVLLRAALHAFFASIAERRGLCVLLDDVDRGDSSSLELFAELGARLSTSRFVLAAAGRPMQGERVLPLARRLMLEPLEDKDVAGVIAHVIGTAPPPALAKKVAACAGGNPALIVSHTRFLIDSHLARFDGTDLVASPDLERFVPPPAAAVLAAASQALLAPATRSALEACAVLGQVVDPDELSALCPDIDVAAALAEGFAHGLLVEERGQAVFWCASELDAIAARIEPSRAKALHVRAAEYLKQRAQAAPHVDLEERQLAHWLAAEEPARAATHAERAADAWAQAGLYDATRDHYRRALHARWRALVGGERSEESARTALELAARATTAIGDVEPSAAVDLALPIARLVPDDQALTARVDAMRARAALLVKLRRTEEALSLLDDTLERSLDKVDAATWGSLLLELGLAMEQSGNPDGARAQLFAAQQTLEQAAPGTPTRMFEVLLAGGRLALRARDFGRARELLTMAVEDARKRKSVSSLIDSLSIMSALDQAEGKIERSLALLDDALSAAASVGDGVAEARLKQQAARILQQLGRIPDALHVARQALLAAQQLGWDEGASVAGQLVQTLESRV